MTQPHSSDETPNGGDIFSSIRALRQARKETGAQFGAAIGLSKSKVSELESGGYSPSVAVALRIEQLSDGRIDAAELCEDVRLARHGLPITAPHNDDATGQNNDLPGHPVAPAPFGATEAGERDRRVALPGGGFGQGGMA